AANDGKEIDPTHADQLGTVPRDNVEEYRMEVVTKETIYEDLNLNPNGTSRADAEAEVLPPPSELKNTINEYSGVMPGKQTRIRNKRQELIAQSEELQQLTAELAEKEESLNREIEQGSVVADLNAQSDKVMAEFKAESKKLEPLVIHLNRHFARKEGEGRSHSPASGCTYCRDVVNPEIKRGEEDPFLIRRTKTSAMHGAGRISNL
ncbi:MAG: hypothetical protein AAF492_12640, partial [Verrucomicrobiota bacterium]